VFAFSSLQPTNIPPHVVVLTTTRFLVGSVTSTGYEAPAPRGTAAKPSLLQSIFEHEVETDVTAGDENLLPYSGDELLPGDRLLCGTV
jgi:hypothetical protein